MSFKTKRNLCILFISILLLLTVFPFLFFQKEQPQGEYITQTEIVVLTELLNTALEEQMLNGADHLEEAKIQKENIELLATKTAQWEVEGYVTYEHFKQWLDYMEREIDILNDEEKESFSHRYRNSFYITKEDWYSYFDKLCNEMLPEGAVSKEELLVLGDSSNVTDVEGNPIEEGYVFTQNGRWKKKLESSLIPIQKKATYITYQEAVWGIYGAQSEAELSNVWIVENTENQVSYFYKNYKVTADKNGIEETQREQVADLVFEDGKLQRLQTKMEKVSGKVLKMSPKEVEIEGLGSYPLAENVQFYRLYDRLENVGRGEVRLGYNFTDFVLEDGKIQAALLVKDEKMENIRVLIKNSNFEGYYHQDITFKANVDMELVYGEESLQIPAGESVSIYPDSEYFVSNRIYLKPMALTGRTIFTNIERNNGGQGYYGVFELERREEGIILVNELLLEEYLYAVVPSEMPGYYPLEALKAQAISARTYAYSKMVSSGLGAYGAHLDDSATYQVYNNIKENVNTTTAVKETRGKLLYSENGLAATYYYSTSCGVGTNGAIWNESNENTLPYLKAKEMTVKNASVTLDDLQTEEGFEEFIMKKAASHFEAEEGWYRWTYEHKNISTVAEKLNQRLESYPNYVSTSVDGVTWGKDPLEEDFVIIDIKIMKRLAGGTIEEVLFITDKGQILVKNEYHIRAVLADGESRAVLQNNSTYACGNLLPSAFFTIDLNYEKEQVTALKLIGGGFGHGVGMSQNGAKNLANSGYSAKEILEFYYEGCEVRE